MMQLPKCEAFLKKALLERQASGIALLVQSSDINELYLGKTAHEGDAIAPIQAHSLFDLASLTKILCTLSLLFIAESEDRLFFSDPIVKYFPLFPDSHTTVLDLINHRSGLEASPDFLANYDAGRAKLGDNRAPLKWICESKLHEKSLRYSDLGYILLGYLLEDRYEKSLPEIFQEKIANKLKLQSTGFVVSLKASPMARQYCLLAAKNHFVASELCLRRHRLLQGEVHDENAFAMGGYAGHAGLFSTLRETKLCFDHLLKQCSANPEFANSAKVIPGEFRFGLMGYPGLRPHASPAFASAIGHTGFTGTSVWHHETTNTTVLLLANRIHPGRKDERWLQTRLDFHDLLWQELGR